MIKWQNMHIYTYIYKTHWNTHTHTHTTYTQTYTHTHTHIPDLWSQQHHPQTTCLIHPPPAIPLCQWTKQRYSRYQPLNAKFCTVHQALHQVLLYQTLNWTLWQILYQTMYQTSSSHNTCCCTKDIQCHTLSQALYVTLNPPLYQYCTRQGIDTLSQMSVSEVLSELLTNVRESRAINFTEYDCCRFHKAYYNC